MPQEPSGGRRQFGPRQDRRQIRRRCRGRYNYGVVAAAAGYTKTEALAAAGIVNLSGSGDKSGEFFNNPRNISMIESGFDAYMAGKITPPK